GFDGNIVHAAARPFLADTTYAPYLLSWPVLRANLRFLARMPVRYLSTLLMVIARLIPHPRAFLRTVAVLPKTVYFAERVERESIPHIHANWASHPATAALVMARLTGVSWSFTGHASDIYIDNAMLAHKIRAAGFVVTCTRHNKDFLARVGGEDTADRIAVSYHGVDLTRFAPADRTPGPFRILTVGTLRECKGLTDLIDACRILADRRLPFEC